MSFFQHLFYPLLPGATVANVVYPRKTLPSLLEAGGCQATGHFSYRTNITISSRLVSLVSGKTVKPDPLQQVKSYYSLHILLSRVLGIRARLRFLHRPALTNKTNVDTLPPLTPDRGESPLSSASGNLPNTPSNNQPLLLRKPAQYFARATPPKVQWQLAPATPPVRSSRAAELPLLLQGIPAQGGSSSSISGRSSPQMASFLDLSDDCLLDNTSSPNPCVDDWSPAMSPPSCWLGSPADWLPDDPCSALPSTDQNLWQPPPYVFLAGPQSGRSLVPTEPAYSRRASPVSHGLAGSELPFGSSESAYHADWTHPDALPTPPTIDPDPYNSNRDKYPDVVTHRGMSYHVIGMLGEGSYGRVMLAVTHAAEVVALKVVHKRKVYREAGVKPTLPVERDCLAAAVEKELPFWVKLRAAWEDEHNLYYAMDACMGTLRDRIANANHARTPLSEDEIRFMCAEMLLALRDLRDMELVHSDIKPENFLITRAGKVVLSDFGFAQGPPSKLDNPSTFLQWRGSPGGTSGYLAPEAFEDGYCCHYSDIFSLGIVFIELMAGMSMPLWDTAIMPATFSGGADKWTSTHPSQRQAWLVKNLKFDNVSETALPRDSLAWDLCMQMLRREPSTGEPGSPQRSVEDLLAHPYFAELNLEAVYQGWMQHDYIPDMNMDHFRIDKEKRDLTFENWHRGLEPDDEYSAGAVFKPVVHNGNVVKSEWLVDSVNVMDQIDGSLERFEWPLFQ